MNSIYGHKKYDIQVVDQRSLDGFSASGKITSGCLVFVYDAGTKTLSTLYKDATGTSLANPITRAQFASDEAIKFYSASTSHDIFVAHSDGSAADYASVTPETHTLPLNRDGVDKVIVFPMVFNSGGTETSTGLSIPLKGHVYDVAVEVTTTDATETVSIGLLSSGTGGDADGFLATASVANAGFVKPYVVTTGSSETYVSTASFGVLMGPSATGADDSNADTGVARGWGYVADGSNTREITYTPSSSDTFAGYGYLYVKKLR